MSAFHKYPANAFEVVGAKALQKNDKGTITSDVKLKDLNTNQVYKVKFWNANHWPRSYWKGLYVLLSELNSKQFNGQFYYSFNLNKPFKIFEHPDSLVGEEANSDDEYCL